MGCCFHNAIFVVSLLTILVVSTSPLHGAAVLRGRMGSRPPRCDRRCRSCGHCEAIQVPTNSQIRKGLSFSGDSNYKPMSWKCKCGSLIFNP